MNAGTPNALLDKSDVGPLGRDVPCDECGYNLRGLGLAGACPECGVSVARSVREWEGGAALPRRAARTLVHGLTILQVSAVGSVVVQPVLWRLETRQPSTAPLDVAMLVFTLFPPFASCWGAWVVSRRSGMPRRMRPAWRGVCWVIRATAVMGFALPFATLEIALFPQPAQRHRALVLAVWATAAATVLAHLYLSRVAAAAGRRYLSWMSREFAAVTLIAIASAWALRQIPSAVMSPTPYLVSNVAGVGFPFAIQRAAAIELRDGWLIIPTFALAAASVASVFLLDALRRSFARIARRAGAVEKTSASSPP